MKLKDIQDSVVKLKIKNGHQILICKGLVNGYKYIGLYSKKIKMEDK